jgi:hypothetical protein
MTTWNIVTEHETIEDLLEVKGLLHLAFDVSNLWTHHGRLWTIWDGRFTRLA